MAKPFFVKTLLTVVGAGALIALGATAAIAGSDHRGDRDHDIRLSDRPKEIVVDNLDTFTVSNELTQEVCGDCHSTDYPATQPKLSCAGWGKEIVKMGNTMGAVTPWNEDGVTKEALYQILNFLADNYGQGTDGCTGSELDALPLNQ